MSPPPRRTLYVDARSLQEAGPVSAEPVRRTLAALRLLRTADLPGPPVRWTALLDGALDPPEGWRSLFDDMRTDPAEVEAAAGDLFLSVSALTCDPLWAAPLLRAPLRRTALLHDALDVLATDQDGRTADLSQTLALAWLTSFHTFLAGSSRAADLLKRRLGVAEPRIALAPPPLERALHPKTAAVPVRAACRHVLLVGGVGATEVMRTALAAHASSRFAGVRQVLVVLDEQSPDERAALSQAYARAGGRGPLAFESRRSPEAVRRLYEDALVVVSTAGDDSAGPAVAEASALGAPVLIAEDAHGADAIDAAWRFTASDPASLARLLDHLSVDASDRERLRRSQRELWRAAAEASFCAAFVWALSATPPPRAKPRPDRTARIALFAAPPVGASAEGLKALARLAEVHLFTPDPAGVNAADWSAVSRLRPVGVSGFDACVHVLGDDACSSQVLRRLLQHGGAAVLEAPRLLAAHAALDEAAAAAAASRELDRPVEAEEVGRWLRADAPPPVRLLGEVARAALPLLAPSRGAADVLQEAIGGRVRALPVIVSLDAEAPQSDVGERAAVRAALGVADDDLLIVCEGPLRTETAPDEALWAMIFLREWGRPARLLFHGYEVSSEVERLGAAAATFGHGGHVLFAPSGDVQERRRHVAAADMGLQLDLRGLDADARPLAAAVAAGLPVVTNRSLAAALDAHAYVTATSDSLSAVLVAEALLAAAGTPRGRPSLEAARRFVRERSPEAYARGLLAELGLAGGAEAPAA